MACANPLTLKSPHRLSDKDSFVNVPCGWCLNCRVDKRNFLEDCCRFTQHKYNSSAFVCLTYDDYHLLDKLNDRLEPSLRRADFQKFIKRLRRYLDYHNLYDNNYLYKDFQYIACGEYGDQFARPHYHIIFFGIDSRFLDTIITKIWQGGICESKPLKPGGIRYVLSYLEKQVFGDNAKELYDDVGLERPFACHSNKLCRDFIIEHLDYIKDNNFFYKFGKNSRPVPSYYKRLMCSVTYPDYTFLEMSMRDNHVKCDCGKRYSLKKMNEYRHNKALMRHDKLMRQARNNLHATNGLYFNPDKIVYNALGNNQLKELALYGDVVPF